MKRILTILIFIISFSNIFSQVNLDENFSYTAGDSIGAHGWVFNSGTTNTINVTSPGLSFSGYINSGIGNAVTLNTNGNDAYKDLAGSDSTGSFYVSFMVRVDSAKSQGDYFVALLQTGSPTLFEGRVSAAYRNGNLVFGITKANASSDTAVAGVWTSGSYTLGTTYLVVLKYTFVPGASNNDQVSLFIFSGSGVPLTEPAPTLGPNIYFSSDATSIGRLALRQGTATRAPYCIVDGIRVSRKWSNITTQIDSFAVSNIYFPGSVPALFGLPDTLGIRVQQFYNNTKGTVVCVVRKNDSLTGPVKDSTCYLITKTTPFDTILKYYYDDTGEKTDVILVQGLVGDTAASPFGDDTTNNSLSVRINTTSDEYNNTDPYKANDSSIGFIGDTGNLVAGFNNRNISSLNISQVDHCLLPSTNGGTYKIEVFGDNGSGKPGPLLYLSPPLTYPFGTGSEVRVNHTLTSTVSIPGNSRFYVGYKQTNSIGFKACTQNESPVRTKTFFYSNPDTSNTWTDFSSSSYNQKLDISVIINTGTLLNLTVIPEAFYRILSNSLNMKDTVRAYLRNSTAPYSLVDSAKANIDSLTFTGAFSFKNMSSGNYYIQVKHRNCIETWSKAGGESFTSGVTKSYDFTGSASQAYAGNMILRGSKYCIYSGDPNQDGFINLSDVLLTYNASSAFTTGYVVTDINGDIAVDLSDVITCYNNSSNFVTKITP